MEYIEITGGSRISGALCVQGSKNLALPVMAACILHKGTTVLHNCPRISDVRMMISILEELGAVCEWMDHTLVINARNITGNRVPEHFGKTMRSSITLAGALLGRQKEFRLPYPGGCVIGRRPIDFHLKSFQAMGTEITEEEQQVCGKAKVLSGSYIRLPFPSVGATENIILAAVLARGCTVIEGAAREPEIEGLCLFLNGMGAKIKGGGTSRILIEGVKELKDSTFTLWGDRIVAGTYLLAAIGSRGKILLENVPACQLYNLKELVEKMGAEWREEREKIWINTKGATLPVPYVRTSPYPGFSTDLQSQLLAVLSEAAGNSVVEETIFEARFKIVEALKIMGADIQIQKNRVLIRGVKQLKGASLNACELRGGAALVVAGIMAEGETKIGNPHFIDRGYENICSDLESVGAKIRRKNYEQT